MESMLVLEDAIIRINKTKPPVNIIIPEVLQLSINGLQ
jgi:hypothetical protein